jgi:hypothetical protein
MLPVKPSSKKSGPTTKFGRLIAYDREIFIQICRRLVAGEDPEAICCRPPMPIPQVFLGWVRDHQEAREIYRSVRNFECDQVLAKELGVSAPTAPDEWEEQIRSNVRRGFQADWLDRKYIPPDWNKVYPSIGEPQVWSTENMQGYNDLLDTFTQMLEPRDLTELIWTKEATDATWEASRAAREKNRVPERRYQKQIREAAQYQRRADAAEALLARPATALNHSFGLEAGFQYYQALDMAQSRANKRRDNALRQIALWRRGLGAKARALSDRFIAEQFLAERYGADKFVADAQVEASTGQPIEADRPLPRAAAEVAPPLAPAQEVAEEVAPLAPALASADETAEGAPPPGSAGEATETSPSLASPVVSTDAAVETAAPVSFTSRATNAPPLVSAAGDAPEAPAVLTSIREAAEAAPRPEPLGDTAEAAPPGQAAQPAPLVAPSAEATEAAPLIGSALQVLELAPPLAPVAEEPNGDSQ